MHFVIIHGITGFAGQHWQQELHDFLIQKHQQVSMPTLPNPDRPDRKECLALIQELTKNTPPAELVFVGHSLGVATALDYIETLDEPIAGLFSVAGFYQDYGAELNSYFLSEKQIDIARCRHNILKAEVIYGDDDPYVPQATLKALADGLQVAPVVIPKGGHLNARAGYAEFPMLLTLVSSVLLA